MCLQFGFVIFFVKGNQRKSCSKMLVELTKDFGKRFEKRPPFLSWRLQNYFYFSNKTWIKENWHFDIHGRLIFLEKREFRFAKDDNFECGYFKTSISKAFGCPGRVRVVDVQVGQVRSVLNFEIPVFEQFFFEILEIVGRWLLFLLLQNIFDQDKKALNEDFAIHVRLFNRALRSGIIV